MKTLAIPTILALTLQCLRAQEPINYDPGVPDGKLPGGLNREQYIEMRLREEYYPIKVTFRVIGEDGMPIPDADMDVGINSILHPDGYNNYKGKTDAGGMFTVESRGQGCSFVQVEKNGYYPSRPKVRWSGELNNDRETMKKVGFRPWNPTVDVILRKVGKPIPMRVWRGGTDGAHRAPGLDEEFGFDLYEKDWIQPQGAGMRADLLVKFTSKFEDQTNYHTTCLIRFANPDDGFIPVPELVSRESLLKYPREAPLDGYVLKGLKIEDKSSGEVARHNAIEREPMGYFVRLRSVKDERTGKIVSAFYGKITAPMERVANANPFEIETFSRDHQRRLILAPKFRFNFYLNPNLNDRNLEYDQRNNLAPKADKDLWWDP